MVPQVLVHWSHIPGELATWEDKAPLRQQFPRALACPQAGSQGKGDVTATDHVPIPAEASLMPEEPVPDVNEVEGGEPKEGRP